MSFLFDLSMSLNCSIFKPICGEKGGDSNGCIVHSGGNYTDISVPSVEAEKLTTEYGT